MYKIRKSTKKSLSGSLTKKPSGEMSIRQDTKFEKIYGNSNQSNQNSASSSPKNQILDKGKTLFKNGNLLQALSCFQKGR